MSTRRDLADGRASRGYVPMEVEALEAPVSPEAIGLLMRLRQVCVQRESDGLIDAVAVESAVVRLSKSRRQKLLAELADQRLVELLPNGAVLDVNYAVWCRTHEQREQDRGQWRERQHRSRGRRDVTPVSRRDKPVSHADVTRDSRVSHGDVTDESRQMSRPPSPDPSPRVHVHAKAESTPPQPPQGAVRVLAGEFSNGYEAFLGELCQATGRHFRGDAVSRSLYAKRRRDGYADADLAAAARGVALSKHHMGLNDSQLPYNGPANVLRSKVLDSLIGLGSGEVDLVHAETADERREREWNEMLQRRGETPGGHRELHA